MNIFFLIKNLAKKPSGLMPGGFLRFCFVYGSFVVGEETYLITETVAIAVYVVLRVVAPKKADKFKAFVLGWLGRFWRFVWRRGEES